MNPITNSKRLAIKFTQFVGKYHSTTSEDLIKIEYGFHGFFMNIYKVLIILLLAYILGILKYTIISFAAFSVIRSFAHGIHARKWWTCLLATLTVLFLPIFISIYFSLNQSVLFFIFLINLSLMYLYAPADTENKPLPSRNLRSKLKKLSLGSVILLYILSLVVKDSTVSSIINLATSMECIMILPITYQITKRRYKNYEYFQEVSSNRSINA